MTKVLPHFSHTLSDVGRDRKVNEDACADVALADGRLIVIADGMGGHEAGDVASKIVVDEVERHFKATEGGEPRERLYESIEAAHQQILSKAAQTGAEGMGSTVVACLIDDTAVYVGWVGDSRLYWFRDANVYDKTVDHTRVQRMLAAGILSPEEAKHHPDANVITRAVGHFPKDGDGEFKVDVKKDPLQIAAGDSLVLCSDGLYDLLEDDEIADIIGGLNAKDGAIALIRVANERGGHDNITVSVVHFGQDMGASRHASQDLPRPRTTSPALTAQKPARVTQTDRAVVGAADRAREHLTDNEVVFGEPSAPPQPDLRIAVFALAALVLVLGAAVIYLVSRDGDSPTASSAPDVRATPAFVGTGTRTATAASSSSTSARLPKGTDSASTTPEGR